jgi:hypothetical protein
LETIEMRRFVIEPEGERVTALCLFGSACGEGCLRLETIEMRRFVIEPEGERVTALCLFGSACRRNQSTDGHSDFNILRDVPTRDDAAPSGRRMTGRAGRGPTASSPVRTPRMIF